MYLYMINNIFNYIHIDINQFFYESLNNYNDENNDNENNDNDNKKNIESPIFDFKKMFRKNKKNSENYKEENIKENNLNEEKNFINFLSDKGNPENLNIKKKNSERSKEENLLQEEIKSVSEKKDLIRKDDKMKKEKEKSNEKVEEIEKEIELSKINESQDEEQNVIKKIIFFNFSPSAVFFSCCCTKKNKKKLELYDKSYKKLDFHLNIFFYLKMIQEIEIIKTLMFDNDQTGLIDFISKPMMASDIDINYESGLVEKILDEELNLNNALNAYNNILKKKSLKEYDIKLINIMKYELDNIFG